MQEHFRSGITREKQTMMPSMMVSFIDSIDFNTKSIVFHYLISYGVPADDLMREHTISLPFYLLSAVEHSSVPRITLHPFIAMTWYKQHVSLFYCHIQHVTLIDKGMCMVYFRKDRSMGHYESLCSLG